MGRPKNNRFYVCYKGDEIISCGTIQEIADKLGMTYRHAYWLTSKDARKRDADSFAKNGHSKRTVLIEG